MGTNVNIFTAGHSVDVSLRIKELEYAYPIEIGDNTWIGGGLTLNAGITVGKNTVIESGSFVTKNTPDHVVAAENLCKVILIIEN
ncbi:MAG: DapH/DapD/GlmU-related protein [Turicibacter sp.]